MTQPPYKSRYFRHPELGLIDVAGVVAILIEMDGDDKHSAIIHEQYPEAIWMDKSVAQTILDYVIEYEDFVQGRYASYIADIDATLSEAVPTESPEPRPTKGLLATPDGLALSEELPVTLHPANDLKLRTESEMTK